MDWEKGVPGPMFGCGGQKVIQPTVIYNEHYDKSDRIYVLHQKPTTDLKQLIQSKKDKERANRGIYSCEDFPSDDEY